MLECLHPREARTMAAEDQLRKFIYFSGNKFEYADKFVAFASCLNAIATHTAIQPVAGRANELAMFLADFKKKHRLRDGELLRLVSSELATDAKYFVRWERHKRTDKPGGLV